MVEIPVRKKRCPNCGGTRPDGTPNISKPHVCAVKDCNWLICECGHTWDLRTAQHAQQTGRLKDLTQDAVPGHHLRYEPLRNRYWCSCGLGTDPGDKYNEIYIRNHIAIIREQQENKRNGK